MLYVFQLGPIETADGSASHCYFGLTPEAMLRPQFGDARKALQALARESKAKKLACEPALARVGKALGFSSPRNMPDWVAQTRADLAFGLTRPSGSPFALAVPPFLEGVWAFLEAEPWQRFGNDDALAIDVTRDGVKRTYEGCVLGASGIEFGLALYEKKGAVARVGRARSFEEARAENALSLTMDDEPAWALEALRDGYGLDAVPVAIRLVNGRGRLASDDELLPLAAVLHALANLEPDEIDVTGKLECESVIIETRIRVA